MVPDSGARFARAVSPPVPRDPRALRVAMDTALARGAAVGDVYRRLVRPMLVAQAESGVARSGAQAALAALTPRLAVTDEGLGRRACVLRPAGFVGELDARAIADGLEAGGWTPMLVALDDDAGVCVDAVVRAEVELMVLPVGDSAQVLASQLPLALLRRLNAPPLIVGVAFAGAEPEAVAADHVVGDVEALAPLLARRLAPTGDAVPWGVRMHREGDALVVIPSGALNTTSVSRLREIVETRRSRYPRILIDLRELTTTDPSGLTSLATWATETPWPPTISTLGDPRTLAAL